MNQSPKVDVAELRALVSTLESLIAEASRVTGELKAAIASAEQTSDGSVTAAAPDRSATFGNGAPDGNRGAAGARPHGSAARARRPAATPWARKRANTATPGSAGAAGVAVTDAPALPLPPAAEVAREPTASPVGARSQAPGTVAAVTAPTAEPPDSVPAPAPAGPPPGPFSFEIAGAAGEGQGVPGPPGPPPKMAAEAAGPARETRRAPKLLDIGSVPPPAGHRNAPQIVDSGGVGPTAPAGHESRESAAVDRGGLPEFLFTAIAGIAPVAPPGRDRPASPDSSSESPPGSAHHDVPVSGSGESPPELALLVDDEARPPAGPGGQPDPTDPAQRAPVSVPLKLVADPGTPAVPGAEPDSAPASEARTVAPMPRRDRDSGVTRLVHEMARRHGLESRGFETAGIEAAVVHEIGVALDDLLGKYPVPLYGIEVAEQREDTIRRERTTAASGVADLPEVWITLEQDELAEARPSGPGQTRRRFRRSGDTGRPVHAAVVRAFAAALDEVGGYRARQEAWRILMAGSLSGGPTIGSGLLDPRCALIDGFAEFELRGKRAGEPAVTLHATLLKMAQAKPEETSA